MRKTIALFIFFLLTVNIFSQKDLEKELAGNYDPNELVTISEYLSYDLAIAILSKISQKMTGRTIVSSLANGSPIGFQITNMPYKKALKLIVQSVDLMFEEKDDMILIKKKDQPVVIAAPDKAIYAPVDSREVKISAVFFETDEAAMRERGINWKWLLSGQNSSFGLDLKTFGSIQGATGTGSTVITPTDFGGSGATKLELGNLTGDASGLFRFFESQNLGEIIASPSITVRDKFQGRIQIGSDFSTKQRDFAGNVTDVFFSTGSIISVTPHIYTEDSVSYVLLKLAVERSTAFPSEISTEIRKTKAETEIMMLDGEQTIIGGLFVNDETKVRTGIPFLKDLPWWFLGIRYLTGSDQIKITKKEVVILIKAEIAQNLKERMKNRSNENLIKKELQKNQDTFKEFKNIRPKQTGSEFDSGDKKDSEEDTK